MPGVRALVRQRGDWYALGTLMPRLFCRQNCMEISQKAILQADQCFLMLHKNGSQLPCCQMSLSPGLGRARSDSLANPDGRSGNYHASCFAPRLLLWGDFRTQEEIQVTTQSLLLFEPQKLRICFLFGFFGGVKLRLS